MKRTLRKILVLTLFVAIPAGCLFADPPDPPGPGGDPSGNGGGTPVGGKLDDGTTVLISLGAGYAFLLLARKRRRNVTSPAA
jgi:hypothetical protein